MPLSRKIDIRTPEQWAVASGDARKNMTEFVNESGGCHLRSGQPNRWNAITTLTGAGRQCIGTGGGHCNVSAGPPVGGAQAVGQTDEFIERCDLLVCRTFECRDLCGIHIGSPLVSRHD